MPAPMPRIDEAQEYLDKVIASLHALDRREKQPLIGGSRISVRIHPQHAGRGQPSGRRL